MLVFVKAENIKFSLKFTNSSQSLSQFQKMGKILISIRVCCVANEAVGAFWQARV